MILLTLDADFMPLKYISFFNLQWNRKYYECGEFSVRIPAEEYTAEMKYIYRIDREETAIIHKVEYSDELKGHFIQLSGFFLEYILNDKIVYPTFYATGNIETELRTMIANYKDDIPLLSLGEVHNLGTTGIWQNTGDTMLKVVYSQLKPHELSCKCRFDLVDNAIYFEVWQGLDRTQNQSTNTYVTFSEGFKNLIKAQIDIDNSNQKNYAIVAGAGEGADRIYEIVDLAGDDYAKQVFIDARDLQYDAEEQTETEYRAALQARGVQALLDYIVINNIDIDVSSGVLRYGVDFDLGDKCDVIINSVGVLLECRIVEIYEVIKNNQQTITIVLGDKKLTTSEKARLK